jgi:hypothetical protein
MSDSKRPDSPRAKSQRSQQDISRSNDGFISNRMAAILSVIILFHLVVIVCWTIPVNWPPVAQIRQFARPYLLWTGLDQYWDMFSPNPPDTNFTLKAVVVTQQRHIHIWTFPHDPALSWPKRAALDRYRAFQELIVRPGSGPLMPELAQHIARSFYNPSDPPKTVMIVEFERKIVPGEDESLQADPTPKVLYDDYVYPGGQP